MELPAVRHMTLTCYILSRLPTQWHPCSGGHVSRSQHWSHLELYLCRLRNQCKDCRKLPRLELVSEHVFELYCVAPCVPNSTDSFVSLFAVMPTRLVVIRAFTHTAEQKRTFFPLNICLHRTPLSSVGCELRFTFICLPRSMKSPAVKQRLTVDPGGALFVVNAKTIYFTSVNMTFSLFFVYILGFGVSVASFLCL